MNIHNYQTLVDFEFKLRTIRNDEKSKIILSKKRLNVMINGKLEFKEDQLMINTILQLLNQLYPEFIFKDDNKGS